MAQNVISSYLKIPFHLPECPSTSMGFHAWCGLTFRSHQLRPCLHFSLYFSGKNIVALLYRQAFRDAKHKIQLFQACHLKVEGGCKQGVR